MTSLGISPSSFIEKTTTEDPFKTNTGESQPLPDSTYTHDETEAQPLFHHQPNDETDNDDPQLGPTPPTPQLLNLTYHQKRHTPLQKEMTLYFQACAESPPTIDPIQTAMLTLDASATTGSSPSDDSVDKYLPEPQSFKAVLKLDDDIRSAWLHAIKMEIKNLIDHKTFVLGEKPRKDD